MCRPILWTKAGLAARRKLSEYSLASCQECSLQYGPLTKVFVLQSNTKAARYGTRTNSPGGGCFGCFGPRRVSSSIATQALACISPSDNLASLRVSGSKTILIHCMPALLNMLMRLLPPYGLTGQYMLKP